MDIRAYDPAADAEAFWELKAAFERELGAGGGEEKAETYEGKLTEQYREDFLSWAAWCVEHDPGCIVVADADGLVGYVFMLPEQFAFIWDSAVLNELYVAPVHRGTGLVDDLVEAGLDVARGQHLPLSRVVLDVDRENERAYAVYDRHGFEHWAELVERGL
jgi:ribosomal protein S18 acetylase RimI-like enzyme